MTTRAHILRVLRPVAVLVLAGIGFALFVPQQVAVPSRLSALAVTTPHVGSIKFKTAESQVLQTSAISLQELKKAQSADPTQAGAFVRAWTGPAATAATATVLVGLLPTVTQAQKALAEARTSYTSLSATKLATDHLTMTSKFGVPGVPGSTGVSFSIAKTSSTPAGTLYAVVFGVGRVVAVDYLETTSGTITRGDLDAFAQAEHALLIRTASGFSMTETNVPVPASVGVAGGAVLVAAGVYFVPEWVQRRRHVRAARQAVRARYEYRARGRKVVNRQRTPSWARRR